jgi:hypothetical protein
MMVWKWKDDRSVPCSDGPCGEFWIPPLECYAYRKQDYGMPQSTCGEFQCTRKVQKRKKAPFLVCDKKVCLPAARVSTLAEPIGIKLYSRKKERKKERKEREE